jgi:hypothetical protein
MRALKHKGQFADNGARMLPNPRVTLGNENTSLLFLLSLSLSLSRFLSIQLVDSLNIQDHRDVAAPTVAFAPFGWIDRHRGSGRIAIRSLRITDP